MNSSNRITGIAVALFMLLFAVGPVVAHPGHGGENLVSGLAHPIAGIDHLLAMVGVGLLGVGLKRYWIWALPLTFMIAMLIGAAMGTAGWFVPSWLAEAGIAGSVFVFGVLITLGTPLPAAVAAALTALFALCHGSAHAAEMPDGGSIFPYFAGFTVSTFLLHAIGIGIGLAVARIGPQIVLRTCGAAIGAVGLLMLVGVM